MGLLWLWMGLFACSGDDDGKTLVIPEPTGTADTGPPTVPTADTGPVDTTIRLLADAGFRASSVFTPGSLEAQDGQDLLFNWSAVSADARGRTIAPADVHELVLMELSRAREADTIALLSGRGPTPSDALEWWSVPVEGLGFVNLSAFVARGAPFVPEAYFTSVNDRGWLLLLRDADGGLLHASTLAPVAGGSTSVPLNGQTSSWTWSATVGEGAPGVAGDAPVVDWSLWTDLYGAVLDEDLTDELFVARLPSGAPVDVETVLADAEQVYRREVVGDDTAELSFLRAADASTFPGFDTDSTWVVGLRCSTCSVRAPLSLVTIDVTP